MVDEDQAERLLRTLHQLLFVEEADNPNLGPSWQSKVPKPDSDNIPTSGGCVGAKNCCNSARPPSTCMTPPPSESAPTTCSNCLGSIVLYAIKANAFEPILSLLWDQGLGLECVSPVN